MYKSIMLVVLLMLFATTSSVVAETETFSKSFTSGNWYMITLPGIPLNPDPTSMFNFSNVDLKRQDAPHQSLITYDDLEPELFGNMLVADGFWVYASASSSMSFSGVDDIDDMEVLVDLPREGWTLIGNPFQSDITWENVKVTNGCATLSMADATTAGWIYPLGYTHENSSLYTVGIPDEFPELEYLPEWHGMWVISRVDNIALILLPDQQ